MNLYRRLAEMAGLFLVYGTIYSFPEIRVLLLVFSDNAKYNKRVIAKHQLYPETQRVCQEIKTA